MFTDSIAKKDLLGRREFAQHIAKKLFKSSEIDASGFVTALTGKWGIGKSTLLSFIEDELHELCINNPKYKFISFNPWMFADEADIKKVFLKNLAKGVNENKYERVKEKWGNKIAKLVRFISSLWPGAKEPGNILSDLIEKYCSKNFIQYKSVIDKKLLDSNLKLFVFIDDIDRLIPKQVFEILQILKLTCNFKNTYYIIAYDREAVEISIETQFKDYGRKFLDKIVQADFLIPEAPLEKIEIIFFSEIEKIRNDFSIVFDSSALSSIWLHRGLKSYFATLRDVYRYINSIRFSLPAIAHEVDVNDFIILEAIRIYDFEKYEKIYTDYSLKIFSFGVAIEFGTDKYLELINNRITRQLVSFLFPQKEYLKKADKKRLNDPDYFFRYFTLQLTSKDVAEFELQKIMLDEERRRELLNTILEQNRMNNLVVRLNDSNLNLKYKEWNFKLINDVYSFFNDNAEKLSDISDRFSDSIINLMYLKGKERNLYFDNFLNLLVTGTNKVEYGRIYFLHFIVLSKVRDTGFPNVYEFKEFYLSKYDSLKDFYLTYLKEWKTYFLNSTIPNFEIPKPLSYYTAMLIYDYARFFGSEYYAVLDIVLSVNSNLLFFIKNILSISNELEAHRINKEALDLLLPEKYRDIFFEKLKTMDTLRLTDSQNQWRDFLVEYNKN